MLLQEFKSRSSRISSAIISICFIVYFIIVIIAWVLVLAVGDLWWPITFLLFAPRWLFALPAVFFIPFALLINRRLLLPLVVALLIILGPFMGFNVTINKISKPVAKPLRIVTCNLQNGKFDLNALNALIQNTQPEIVALQELPSNIIIKSLDGWQHLLEGDLHIYSRYPVTAGDFIKANVPKHKWPRTCFLYCTVKAPSGDLTFCTVHMPSPRYGLQAILDKSTLINLKRKKLLIDETEYRRQKSLEISAIVDNLPSPKVVAGDFNMPVESTIYRKYWSAYQNVFSQRGFGYGWTEWVSVRSIPVGVRIDHVLIGKGLTPLVCETGTDVGSDHLPVIADIVAP
ncbi:endonuclease/exonuclease/phosphatase family protein [Geoanaerobacter pelophilus]|uniref:endonuclease/exonuclease/phosphatase family protein n=1 Tax=Geoanaerobacter pelophilus TaxID=60036 RepID=UPI001BDA37C9|nr:endonuclease/exonuclease/phosphatase family protein [Geoanaerobacter pelophilus]